MLQDYILPVVLIALIAIGFGFGIVKSENNNYSRGKIIHLVTKTNIKMDKDMCYDDKKVIYKDHLVNNKYEYFLQYNCSCYKPTLKFHNQICKNTIST